MAKGTPSEAVAAFDAAIASGDEAAAQSVSVRWDGAGDNPRKLFNQGTRKGFRLQPMATVTQPERAIVGTALVISAPKTNKRGERLWILLQLVEDAWKIAGVTQSPAFAAFFLDGLLKPGQGVDDLPDSPDAGAFVSGLLDPTSPHPDGPKVRNAAPAGATIASSKRVDGTVRHIVELGGGDRRGPWVLLNRGEDGFSIQGVSQFRELGGLLDGMALAYGLDASKEKGMSDDKIKMSAESPEAKAALAAVFQDAIKQIVGEGAKGVDGKGADALLGLFQAALQQSATPKVAPDVDDAPATDGASAEGDANPPSTEATDADPVVDLASERKKRGIHPPSEFEQKIQDSVRGAFNDYVVENVSHGAEDGAEISVDADFIKQHGPALFGTVLQAFARSLIPEEIKVELPVAKPATPAANAETPAAEGEQAAAEGDKPKVVPDQPGVKLKVDFNGLINGLLSSVAKPKAPDQSE